MPCSAGSRRRSSLALMDQHLRPLGLIRLADGSEPPLKRSNPLLGLKLKYAVTDPVRTRRITDPFRVLFRPLPMALVVLGFLAVTAWVFFWKGLGPAAYDAFQRPHLLLLVFAVTVLSGGFHEFGHAAAARYSGADPGTMGAGLYLVWPAFYTDVTDSYRLPRGGRIRTDLGGLYFNAIVVVLTFGWWSATHWDALLLLVATQILQMVQQLMPTMRFDGYHVLADLAGVPDLYQRIRPTLAGLLPHRWSDPSNRLLKPWARVVITAWVLVTVPMMVFLLLTMVVSIPRMLGSGWAAVTKDGGAVAQAWHQGAALDVAGNVAQVLSVVLPLTAGAIILGRLSLRSTLGLAGWSRGSMPKRAMAMALTTLVVTGLAWAWMPTPGKYRPIGPDERGLLTSVLPGAERSSVSPAAGVAARPGTSAYGAAAHARLSGKEPLAATFQQGAALPTKAHPQLAMVLVPSSGAGHGSASPAPGQDEQPWVFPFDKPLPPAQGDNQAAAYNTTDGSTKYDVAFALVWATGDEVLNVNEAHAYASCSNCVTVAVAFQVVLIMDDAHVVVPQNLAVSANYQCYRCITAALASQLVLSVEKTPGESELRALGDVWARLIAFGQQITAYSLTEIASQLKQFQSEITTILGEAGPVSTTATATPAPSAGQESSAPPAPGTTPSPASPTASSPAPEPTAPSTQSSSGTDSERSVGSHDDGRTGPGAGATTGTSTGAGGRAGPGVLALGGYNPAAACTSDRMASSRPTAEIRAASTPSSASSTGTTTSR